MLGLLPMTLKGVKIESLCSVSGQTTNATAITTKKHLPDDGNDDGGNDDKNKAG